MAFAAMIPGTYNTAFDPKDGRRGRRQHALAPTFDPLGRIGDTAVTKPLSSAEAEGMWDYFMKKAGMA